MVEYPPGMNSAPREPGPAEVKYVHTAGVYLRAALWTLALIATLVLGLTAWNTALIRHQQVQNRGTLVNTASAAHDAKVTADAIHSCVTPGESCFERAQRRQAGAVQSINHVVILAAACSSGLAPGLPVAEKQSRIQTCVIDRLAVGAHKR